ncbi:MBOAT family O-acyltransferase [Paraburkholderia saeva]|uniref:MBOAT family O-acyltransferase n=1 Tax=Paraburkholderia saeva TaxID=2777537 RepID=UPI001D20FEB6|nr:MBOAT family protein [Paraburkholderia saeva]CAG4901400.1 Peptidoglycan O-acetyltransferase [Paraburkholderia saeva]CAG4907129.1 Peptidoglycan O-acetyltransferase [Paraburkholderia saeva]
MVFSSIVFLGLFLPVTFVAYHLAPTRFRNALLALASIAFYAWGEPRFVILMLVSVVINFYSARLLDQSKARRAILSAAVTLNLLILALFKYGNFIVDNLNVLLAPAGIPAITIKPIALPIGISFYTFHAISYLIDIYRRNAKPNTNIVEYSLYIMLFPQLVAGPIIRYKDIYTQLSKRAISFEDINAGIMRFTMGLSKKVLIANQFGMVADAGFNTPADQLGALVAWACLLCYTLQIYFDFSGYSDMAIGLGRMFGFRFPENFNYPYSARSIQDFWRRWHISLSTWFRDYVYIPLGGNRKGEARTLLNLWTVFLLTGIWHGASWNFVIWGAIHGFFLMLERFARRLDIAVPRTTGQIYAILVVMLAWVFFRTSSLEQAAHYLLALAGHWPRAQWTVTIQSIYSTQTLTLFSGAVLLALGFYPAMRQAAQPVWRRLSDCAMDGWARAALVAPALILSCMSIALGQYNPFIYFRF